MLLENLIGTRFESIEDMITSLQREFDFTIENYSDHLFAVDESDNYGEIKICYSFYYSLIDSKYEIIGMTEGELVN